MFFPFLFFIFFFGGGEFGFADILTVLYNKIKNCISQFCADINIGFFVVENWVKTGGPTWL